MAILKGNKKGMGIDNIWVAVSFFGLAIFFLALMVGWNAINTGMTDLWTGSSIGTGIQNNAQAAVNQFDWIMAMVWISLHLGILVTAFLLRTHPVVYIASILIIAILAILAAPLSNAWADIIVDGDLSTAATSFPMTSFILNNFPKLEVIWAFVTAVIMFGLARMEGFL